MKSILASLILPFLCCSFIPIGQVVLLLGEPEGVACVMMQDKGTFVDGFAVDGQETVYFTGGGTNAVILCRDV